MEEESTKLTRKEAPSPIEGGIRCRNNGSGDVGRKSSATKYRRRGRIRHVNRALIKAEYNETTLPLLESITDFAYLPLSFVNVVEFSEQMSPLADGVGESQQPQCALAPRLRSTAGVESVIYKCMSSQSAV